MPPAPPRGRRLHEAWCVSMTETARDQRLADLLSDLTEQCRRGQLPDLDAVARQHPDLADELRELWAAVQIADEFGKFASDQQATLDWEQGSPPGAPATPLPRPFGDYELLEE